MPRYCYNCGITFTDSWDICCNKCKKEMERERELQELEILARKGECIYWDLGEKREVIVLYKNTDFGDFTVCRHEYDKSNKRGKICGYCDKILNSLANKIREELEEERKAARIEKLRLEILSSYWPKEHSLDLDFDELSKVIQEPSSA